MCVRSYYRKQRSRSNVYFTMYNQHRLSCHKMMNLTLLIERSLFIQLKAIIKEEESVCEAGPNSNLSFYPCPLNMKILFNINHSQSHVYFPLVHGISEWFCKYSDSRTNRINITQEFKIENKMPVLVYSMLTYTFEIWCLQTFTLHTVPQRQKNYIFYFEVITFNTNTLRFRRGARKIAQSVKCFFQKHKDVRSILGNHLEKAQHSGMYFNLNTGEVELGRS